MKFGHRLAPLPSPWLDCQPSNKWSYEAQEQFQTTLSDLFGMLPNSGVWRPSLKKPVLKFISIFCKDGCPCKHVICEVQISQLVGRSVPALSELRGSADGDRSKKAWIPRASNTCRRSLELTCSLAERDRIQMQSPPSWARKPYLYRKRGRFLPLSVPDVSRKGSRRIRFFSEIEAMKRFRKIQSHCNENIAIYVKFRMFNPLE